MMKQMGAQGSRLRLPLNQTVFLPREAMGVRYIDKVRTAVFVEKVSAGEQGLWLRGLYELDLEYQGMEGGGLHKHRVSLPLKVATPGGWPGCAPQQVEPGELHTAIKKPMIRLLSPYVLEFCAELQIEYLEEARWQEDKLPPPAPAPKHIWCDEVPMPDAAQPDKRLESKIDRFFVGRVADSKLDVKTDAKPDVPTVAAAGRIPDWPGVLVPEASSEVTSEAEKAPEHTLPVWRYVPPRVDEPVTEAVKEAVAAENVEKAVEKPVEKPVESAVENLVKTVAKENAVAKDQAKEQIWAPALNRNRFRAILTAAAIARMKARGENLLAAANQNAENNVANNVASEAEEKGADVILAENVLAENAEKVAEAAEAAEAVEVEEVVKEVTEAVKEVTEAVKEVTEAVEEISENVSAEVSSEDVSEVRENVGEEVAEVAEVPQDEPGVQLVNSRGVKLRLTARQVAPPRREAAKAASSGFAIKYYVVKPGDDAMHIALKHNISLERLREANRLPDGELAAGTLLRIPG